MNKKSLIFIIAVYITFLSSCDNKKVVKQLDFNDINLPASFYQINELPRYFPERISSYQVDLRGKNLQGFNLSDRIYDIEHSIFDNYTKWSEMKNIPYKPLQILNINADPGMNIKKIHKKGITGKGITIAIIDQYFTVDHLEFKNRIKHIASFPDIQNDYNSYHGPAVTSIAIGKNIGVAPEATVVYFSAESTNKNKELTCQYEVEAMEALIHYILEGNIVHALSISSGANRSRPYYQEYLKCRNELSKLGVAIFSTDMFMHDSEYFFYGLKKEQNLNPNNEEFFEPISWNDWIIKMNNFPEILIDYEIYLENNQNSQYPILLPLDGATTVAGNLSDENYCFKFVSGGSWLPPYLAGIYALCCQVDIDIDIYKFWYYMLETGIPYDFQISNKIMHGRLLNIQELINKIKFSV